MNVLLLDPGMAHPKFAGNRYVNRGLLSIATFLQKNFIEGCLLPLDRWRLEGITDVGSIYQKVRKATEGSHYDVIGVSALSIAEFPFTLALCRKISSDFPNSKIVIGGYLPTFEPKRILQENPFIDYLVQSEGEWAFLNLLKHLQDGNEKYDLRNLVYRDLNGCPRIQGPLPMGDLRELPVPDYRLLPQEYLHHRKPPNINIEFNRGCHFNCSFCSATLFWRHQVRQHDLGKIIEELRQLTELQYSGRIGFEDESINIKASEFKEFLRQAKKIDSTYQFDYIVTRYDHIDQESLNLLKKVGFSDIVIGLETASEELQISIGKMVDLKTFEFSARLVKASGLRLNVFLIVGLPGETEDTFLETYRFIDRLEREGLVSNILVSYFQPYVCTRAYEDLHRQGGKVIVSKNDYDAWLMRSRPLVEYPHLKKERLNEMFETIQAINLRSNSDFFKRF